MDDRSPLLVLIEEVIEEVKGYENIGHNWDGEGAEPCGYVFEALLIIQEIYAYCYDRNVAIDYISTGPCPDGGVCITIERNGRYAVVDVGPFYKKETTNCTVVVGIDQPGIGSKDPGYVKPVLTKHNEGDVVEAAMQYLFPE